MKTPHPDPKIRRASQLPQYDREIIVRMLREQISLYLKKRRKGKYSRYSLRRFARDCGIHIETLRKLRRGHTINPKVLEKVLRKMQIKPSIALRFVPNRHVFRKMLPARKPIKPWKRPSQRKKKKPRTRSTKPVPLTKTLVYVLRADKRLAKFLGGADRVLVKWARKQLLDILATSVNRRKELILTGRGSEIDYGGGIRFTPTTEKEKEAAVVL